jgi:CHASE2 domain-containing sensor protein
MNREQEKRKIYRDLFIGFGAIFLLTIVQVYFVEDSRIGRWLDAKGYEFLHKFIPAFDPDKEISVVVLDISNLKRDADGTTPTKDLREIVEALVESRAKAIAIDIDFSPRKDPSGKTVLRNKKDPEFFDFLLDEKKKGVPVFVGVYNIGPEPKTWLGLEDYKVLAADMNFSDENTTEVLKWLKCGDNEKLNSISMALAEASDSRPARSALLKFFLDDPEVPDNLKHETLKDNSGNKISCERADTFVNYAKLELIQNLMFSTPTKEAIVSAKNAAGKGKFEDKLVVIGNAQRGEATDTFVVSVRPQPIPGVYLHASATYTLVDEPIYKFKHWVTILLDIFIGLILVVCLFVFRSIRLGKSQSSSGLWEGLIIIAVIGLTLLIAYLLVRYIDVLWLNIPLVISAIFLHSKVHEGLRWITRRIFRNKRPMPAQAE